MSEARLKQLEDRVTDLNEKRIRAEEQLKTLRKRKDEIIAELDTLGVAPKDLDSAITALETNINTQLADINAQLPEEGEYGQ